MPPPPPPDRPATGAGPGSCRGGRVLRGRCREQASRVANHSYGRGPGKAERRMNDPGAGEPAGEAGPGPVDDEVIELAGRIFDLARAGDAERLAAYLDAGVPANLTNDKGDTLVMLAAYHGHTSAVEALLARGAARTAPTTGARPRWPARCSRARTAWCAPCWRAVPTRPSALPRRSTRPGCSPRPSC